MCKSITNKTGLSLIEVLISLFLISFGILGLISVQPPAWNLSAKSDFLGRAGGILHKELQSERGVDPQPLQPQSLQWFKPADLGEECFDQWPGRSPGGRHDLYRSDNSYGQWKQHLDSRCDGYLAGKQYGYFGKPDHNPPGKFQVSPGVRMNQVRYDHRGFTPGRGADFNLFDFDRNLIPSFSSALRMESLSEV